MAVPEVFFTDLTCKINESLMDKLDRLVRAAGLCDIDMEKKFVAIKMHFGEYGNLTFLRPNFAKVIADIVREKGGYPFLTDCNTLYVGMRRDAVHHLENACMNGFGPLSTGCNVIIADGVKGYDDVEVPVDGEYVKVAKIGRAIYDADVIIDLSHFKCHTLAGFGGSLKNLGMGCGSHRGKLEMHSSKPIVDPERCRGCGSCIGSCAHSALSVDGGTAEIDYSRCVGCGMCISTCRDGAMHISVKEGQGLLNRKIVEYAKAVTTGKPHFHVSFVMDVSPECDCHGGNDVPIVPDIGIFASKDPVALDRACIEAVQRQPVCGGSVLCSMYPGRRPADLITAVHPESDWRIAFDHAEKIGMGDGGHVLVKVV